MLRISSEIGVLKSGLKLLEGRIVKLCIGVYNSFFFLNYTAFHFLSPNIALGVISSLTVPPCLLVLCLYKHPCNNLSH